MKCIYLVSVVFWDWVEFCRCLCIFPYFTFRVIVVCLLATRLRLMYISVTNVYFLVIQYHQQAARYRRSECGVAKWIILVHAYLVWWTKGDTLDRSFDPPTAGRPSGWALHTCYWNIMFYSFEEWRDGSSAQTTFRESFPCWWNESYSGYVCFAASTWSWVVLSVWVI